ncbi:glycosyltransferase family 4 protein [Streptomyces rapamycinicus]|uniref:D-inositol 3-phosphate glycosyltransferase n=2 Tax=Streptomyces rapamycinicus TaxID=1226757 RepID=A0A0A0NPM8_STRRN|nr:glycosyltransferase family 4 protein [Streptomyces rapamycinicus]AGP58884.1 glycosyltransferase [Streptomyces rapamycinicus NRRL 5491]MBB4786605.1 glycosyltransferase involved in cell wall biosynthesis [Streptomyces rapamycinicus]RLV77936.1 glycosyl transferase group 1 [Streptomyces rapamycinicus NRRL 5491]UTO66678.1 glycosyltransferase family 4 protein [Streptomyces rapamycinicus]UTP34632.1 glycosyltransferase family 4 protein [Streptomyces rapamycinicus NRRL 5491]
MSSTVSNTPVPPHARSSLHAVQVLGAGSSGSGVHVRSLSAGLVARGLRVTVCGPWSAEQGYGFTQTGARFTGLDALTDAGSMASLRRATQEAALVHAHGLRSGLLAAVALRGRNVPLIVTWHTRVDAEGARARLVRLMERRVARAAAIVLGASSDLVARARARGARDARLAPVAVPAPRRPPETADGRRQKARAELGVVERPLLVTAGRLEAMAGHGPLLDAARRWRVLDPRPLLVVAGEGPDRAVLQRRIDTEGLPVRLLGRREDVPQLLSAADVAVLSSRWEARSLLAQEALHAGVPLVATAVGGVPELVGEAAELVPYGDPEALADAVTGLLADPVRRVELATAGRARTAGWPTEDDTVAHVLSVYDELVQTFLREGVDGPGR